MRRKPQDRAMADVGDDDSTPRKLRRAAAAADDDGDGRSRYEIDHGSCDWTTESSTVAVATASSSSSSVASHESPCGSPRQSPVVEGLHHRNHRRKIPLSVVPTQRATTTAVHNVHHTPPRLPTSHRRGRSYSGTNGLHGIHGHSSRRGNAAKWKRAFQLLAGGVALGYCSFLYLARNMNWGLVQREHQRPPASIPTRTKGGKVNINSEGKSYNASGKNRGAGVALDGKGRDSKSKKYGVDDAVRDDSGGVAELPIPNNRKREFEIRDRRTHRDAIEDEFREHSFHIAETGQIHIQQVAPLQWSRDHFKRAKAARSNRRTERRRRTQPPIKLKHNDTPLWYKLDHSSEGTISSIHQRWDNPDNDADDIADASTIDDLCGSHAQSAARHHPQNYRQTRPLGPKSRVMITGILSPLGLHLALALRRRCGVSSFLGLDSQIPNDPLGRLEAQERLAALMQELEGFRPLQAPFSGLETKREKKTARMRREERAREEGLRGLRERKGLPIETGGNNVADDARYARPFVEYGIALAPGTNARGEGALDAVLDYRPTHVVHLAGTQSDSLLGSGRPDGEDDLPAFRNRGEEEEGMLRDGPSARPHLYDLRTGAVGMEQLLSGAAAQAALPPRYGRENEGGDVEKPNAGDTFAPHVVYASNYDALRFPAPDGGHTSGSGDGDGDADPFHPGDPAPARPPRGLHGASRLVDEILSSSYRALHGVSSVGLRFDAVYGPRGFGARSDAVPPSRDRRGRRRGVGVDVRLAEAAVRDLHRAWVEELKEREARAEAEEEGKEFDLVGNKKEEERHLSLIEEAELTDLAHDRRDFVFVEDAVGAIIAAMQYRSVQNSPTTFNIGSGELSPLSSLSDAIQDLASPDRERREATKSKNVIDVERSSAARAASLSSHEYLRWASTTSLEDGAARLLAWHLDRALPYFPPDASESAEGESDRSGGAEGGGSGSEEPPDGEGILKRRGTSSCSAEDDATCLREAHARYPCASECATRDCLPSVFDGVVATTKEATEDCDIVLYTMSLGFDVEEMLLKTEFSDGEAQEAWRESTVCTLAFVPSESTLVRTLIDQVPPHSLRDRGVSQSSDHETKVKLLNGYLAHHGWILILVDNATRPLPAEEVFLPKLAPARLFHPSVRKVMFVEEDFRHTPLPDDAQFLTSETSRGVLKKRTVTGPDAKGRKTKYKLPEEPQRSAVLVVSPMRHVPDAAGHKMPLKEIALTILDDLGFDPDKDYSKEARAQQEYYTRARSLVNSMDLRSPAPTSRHRLEIKDFIRSQWVVHHLKLEEGHRFRCEWYREHVRWNSHLDQLSFAYVMAKRELVRRIVTEQPLPAATEEPTLLQRVIQQATDAGDWHPIISAEGGMMPIHHSQISPEAIPINLQDLPGNEVSKVNPEAAFDDVGSTYYVRIMNDARMMEFRKRWMKARNTHRKMVKKMKEAEAAREK